MKFGSGPNGIDGDIEQGKLYYLDSSQQWEETNANAAASATGMIALAIVDDSARFLVKGLARHSSFAGFTTGDVLYVSGTAAGITKLHPLEAQTLLELLDTARTEVTERFTLIHQKTGLSCHEHKQAFWSYLQLYQ